MAWSHGERWTFSKVESALLEEAQRLGRMPTAPELRAAGRDDLAGRISRTQGFRWWAKRLGLTLKGTSTHFGQQWEHIEADRFTAMGFDVQKQTAGAPFDLLVNGYRVDVKASRLTNSCTAPAHASSGLKRGEFCDFFHIVCIGDGYVRRLTIPSESARVHTLMLGMSTFDGRGKYSRFMDCEHLLGAAQKTA